MQANAFTRGVASGLEQTLDYRFTLYQSNGSKVTDSDNNHILIQSAVDGAWDLHRGVVDNFIEYQGDNLLFGPARSEWGDSANNVTVDQIRVEVDFGPGFEYLGSVKIDSPSAIPQGEFLEIDPDQSPLRINYSVDSDSLSTFPTTLDGALRSFFIFDSTSNVVWRFECIKSSGDVHGTVVKDGSVVDWNLDTNNNRITYSGPDLRWPKALVGFTWDKVRIVMERQTGGRSVFGEATVSSTLSAGERPTVEDDSMYLEKA